MKATGDRVDVVLNSLGIGGAERHTIALAQALSAHGFAVRLIALSKARGHARPASPGVVAEAIEIDRRGPFDAGALWAFRGLVRADPPRVTLTVNQYPLAFVAAASPWASRAPILQVMHTIELPHGDNAVKRALYPRLLRRPAAIAYVCELQRQHWRQRGVRARPDHCVHTGVDLARFQPPGPAVRSGARQRFQLPDEAFVVGICAVLRPEKRHDLLLGVIARLNRDGRHVHALLIGDGPERARIEAQAAALGIGHRVTITGYQQDVIPCIAAADAMALVSDYEAFSIAILESMALGKPVVATDAGAVAEQITEGADGFITPKGDEAALARALARLCDHAGLRQALGAQALHTVRSRFDARSMNDKFIRIVGDLAAHAPPARRSAGHRA